MLTGPRGRLAGALLAALLLGGCGPSPTPDAGPGGGGTLTLGLLPDEDPERQARRYAPLKQALEANTGMAVELLLPSTYEELVYRFAQGEVDLAYFGGYTFLRAQEQAGAEPLVMRDIDARFVSYIIVPPDHPARGLAGLQQARFAFGARSSTSGHLMPRYFLSREGIVPEAFFSGVVYSGAHDLTFRLVADGLVDAGVVNGQVVRSMLAGSPAGSPPVRVIWQSPPYVDYVWAVQPGMDQEARRTITGVFLSFSVADPAGREFLESVGASYFIPAMASDFDQLRSALNALPPQAAGGAAE